MHICLIGDPHDVVGFGLAGIAGTECHTRPELLRALDAAEHDPDLALLVLSADAAALGPEAVERLRDSLHPPITIVLPPTHAAVAAETAA